MNDAFSIVLKETAQEKDVARLQSVLEGASYVKAAQYISKEDALKEVMLELGENPEDIANEFASIMNAAIKANEDAIQKQKEAEAAAAKAREVLGAMPEKVVIGASGSIIKNVKSVIVPNTDHMKGIPAAAVAGIVGGDASKELEVIARVSPEDIAAMRTFLENTPITVEHVDNGLTFEIVVTLYKGEDYAKVRIVNYHTNIVLIEKNGEKLFEVVVDGAFLQVSADGIRENKAVGVVPYFRSSETELVLLYLLAL